MLTLRRALGAALGVLVLASAALGSVPGAAVGRAWAAPLAGAGDGVGSAPRLPVVLVAGWGEDPALIWGTNRPGGFYGFLAAAGYSPGRDLVILGPADGEDRFGPALERLGAAVDRACGAGGGRVGLVAHGDGCLLCRAYLATSGDRRVEVLAMVAPPNHGAAWAGYLRLAAELERQGAANRLQPPLSAGGASGFDSAGDYVDRRSRLVYEPLYQEFVRDQFTREPGKGPPGRAVQFEEWLARERPQVWTANLLEAGQPPLGARPPGPASLVNPVQGRGLSRAFYEFLALNVARYRSLKQWSNLGEEVWGLVLSFLQGWVRGRLPLAEARETAASLGRGALEQARLRAESLAATALARARGIDPWSPRLEALLPEELFLPGPSGVPVAVPLNQGLKGFNAWEAAAREAADRGLVPARPRYVVVTGRTPSLLGRLVEGRLGWGPEWDCRSALLRMAEDDALGVWDGPLSAQDLWLLYHPRVHAFLGRQLVAPSLHRTAHRLAPSPGAPACSQGTLPTSALETSFLVAECPARAGPAPSGGPAKLELEITAPPPYSPALRLAAWLHLEGPGGQPLERQQLQPAASPEGAQAQVLVEGWGESVARVRLGLRLVPAWDGGEAGEAAQEPLPPLPDTTPLEVRYRLTVVSGDAPAPAGRGPGAAPGSGGAGQPEAPGPGGGQPSGPAPGGSPALEPKADSGGGRPLIVVQRRDKRTTTKRERRTVHSRWEWDFGDGPGVVDPDPTHLVGEVTHTFPVPGCYRVRAASVSNQGTLLRDAAWEVEVGPDRLTRSFRVETAREPGVRVVVEGPREWVTGRPAEFSVRVEVDPPPDARCRVTSLDPGAEFAVLWEHPGEYQVAAAATIQVTYEFPEGTVTVWNTYLGSVTVVVLATSVSG
ncbi:MAG: hypothetical protein K6T75_08315 [Acetobacteraceae bacterium]|nr:hypothetical protein [Acetobacteraceae bacterium]